MKIKEEKNRIVLDVDGIEIGELLLSNEKDETFTIEHTYVNEKYRGKDYANRLVEAGVKRARREGKKIIPHCPFAKKVLNQTPEYQDVLKK